MLVVMPIITKTRLTRRFQNIHPLRMTMRVRWHFHLSFMSYLTFSDLDKHPLEVSQVEIPLQMNVLLQSPTSTPAHQSQVGFTHQVMTFNMKSLSLVYIKIPALSLFSFYKQVYCWQVLQILNLNISYQNTNYIQIVHGCLGKDK